MTRHALRLAAAVAALTLGASFALAQSGATRPRRVTPAPVVTAPTPAAAATGPTTRPASGARATTASAFALYQQKKFEEALREAQQITAAEPKNSEAWKLAGFSQLELQKYAEAIVSLRRAQDLRRAEGAEDVNIEAALIRAYVSTEQYEQALPLLVAATSRPGAAPDGRLLYTRGIAELRTNKPADAERSFNAAVKADPKNAPALLYLGQLAFQRNDHTAAINLLNRATTVDPRLATAWELLTHSYLRRAAAAPGPKAEADYLAAVRTSESLVRARDDEDAIALHGQALIYAKQYARAATALERAAAKPEAKGTTLYLLGFAHSRAKNFTRALAALERAAASTPDNAEVFRELGFAAESSKQYAKALAAYERGLQLAPEDAYFKESAERVRPFAQQNP